MPSRQPLTYDPPKVIGVADPDVDPAGHIPFELLARGIDVVVKLWDNPAKEDGERDILRVYFEQPGQPLVMIENIYYPADIKPEFIIHIGPEYLKVNGPGNLWYVQFNTADNPAPSFRRTLTIDHSPIIKDLPEAGFPDANGWGYINCQTDPPMWDGIKVKIPPLKGFEVGDRCEIVWRAYISPNGSSIQFRRAYKKIERLAISDQDIKEGFVVVIEPYDVHIKPMEDKASALVNYIMYRGSKKLGQSTTALLRVDRVIPGNGLCGPESRSKHK